MFHQQSTATGTAGAGSSHSGYGFQPSIQTPRGRNQLIQAAAYGAQHGGNALSGQSKARSPTPRSSPAPSPTPKPSEEEIRNSKQPRSSPPPSTRKQPAGREVPSPHQRRVLFDDENITSPSAVAAQRRALQTDETIPSRHVAPPPPPLPPPPPPPQETTLDTDREFAYLMRNEITHTGPAATGTDVRSAITLRAEQKAEQILSPDRRGATTAVRSEQGRDKVNSPKSSGSRCTHHASPRQHGANRTQTPDERPQPEPAGQHQQRLMSNSTERGKQGITAASKPPPREQLNNEERPRSTATEEEASVATGALSPQAELQGSSRARSAPETGSPHVEERNSTGSDPGQSVPYSTVSYCGSIFVEGIDPKRIKQQQPHSSRRKGAGIGIPHSGRSTQLSPTSPVKANTEHRVFLPIPQLGTVWVGDSVGSLTVRDNESGSLGYQTDAPKGSGTTGTVLAPQPLPIDGSIELAQDTSSRLSRGLPHPQPKGKEKKSNLPRHKHGGINALLLVEEPIIGPASDTTSTGAQLHECQSHVFVVWVGTSGGSLFKLTAETPYFKVGQSAGAHDGHGVNALAYIGAWENVISGGEDGTIRIWDTGLSAVQPIRTPSLHFSQPSPRAGTSNPSTASSDSSSKTVPFECTPLVPLKVIQGHDVGVSQLAVPEHRSALSDQMVFASGGFDGTVNLWNKELDITATFVGHQGPVLSLAFVATTIETEPSYSSREKGHITHQHNKSKSLSPPRKQTSSSARRLSFSSPTRSEGEMSPDRQNSPSRVVRVGPVVRAKDRYSSVVTDAETAEGHQQTFLWSGGEDGTVRVWDPVALECVQVLAHHAGPVSSLLVNEGEKKVWSGSTDGTVVAWDPQTFSTLCALTQPCAVNAVVAVGKAVVWRLWVCGDAGRTNCYLCQGSLPATSAAPTEQKIADVADSDRQQHLEALLQEEREETAKQEQLLQEALQTVQGQHQQMGELAAENEVYRNRLEAAEQDAEAERELFAREIEKLMSAAPPASAPAVGSVSHQPTILSPPRPGGIVASGDRRVDSNSADAGTETKKSAQYEAALRDYLDIALLDLEDIECRSREDILGSYSTSFYFLSAIFYRALSMLEGQEAHLRDAEEQRGYFRDMLASKEALMEDERQQMMQQLEELRAAKEEYHSPSLPNGGVEAGTNTEDIEFPKAVDSLPVSQQSPSPSLQLFSPSPKGADQGEQKKDVSLCEVATNTEAETVSKCEENQSSTDLVKGFVPRSMNDVELQALRETISNLQEDLFESKRGHTERIALIDADRIREVTIVREAAQRDKRHLENQLVRLTAELKEVRDQLSTVNDTHRKEREDILTQHKLDKDILLVELQEERLDLQNKWSQAKLQNDGLENELTALRAEVESSKNMTLQLESTERGLEEEKEKCRTLNLELEGFMKHSDELAEKWQATNTADSIRVEEAQRVIESLTQSKQALQEENSKYRTDLLSMKKPWESMKGALRESHEALEALRGKFNEEVAGLEEAMEEREREILDLKVTLAAQQKLFEEKAASNRVTEEGLTRVQPSRGIGAHVAVEEEVDHQHAEEPCPVEENLSAGEYRPDGGLDEVDSHLAGDDDIRQEEKAERHQRHHHPPPQHARRQGHSTQQSGFVPVEAPSGGGSRPASTGVAGRVLRTVSGTESTRSSNSNTARSGGSKQQRQRPASRRTGSATEGIPSIAETYAVKENQDPAESFPAVPAHPAAAAAAPTPEMEEEVSASGAADSAMQSHAANLSRQFIEAQYYHQHQQQQHQQVREREHEREHERATTSASDEEGDYHGTGYGDSEQEFIDYYDEYEHEQHHQPPTTGSGLLGQWRGNGTPNSEEDEGFRTALGRVVSSTTGTTGHSSRPVVSRF